MNFAAYIEEQARNHPNKAALVQEDTTRTYDSLDKKSNAFANWLSETNDEDDIIGLFFPNHIELITLLLGAFKSGVTPLPINYRFTESEIEFVLKNTSATTLVTLPDHSELAVSLQSKVPSLRKTVITGEPDDETEHLTLGEIYEDNPNMYDTRPKKNDSRAMMMFTSGTTGDPKGVQHTHSNLIFNCDGYIDWFELSAADIALNITPLFHVGGLNITGLPTLKSGGTVILLDDWDPVTALELLEHHGVTWSFAIATMLIDLVNIEVGDAYDLSSVRFIGYGGSPLPENIAQSFEEKYEIPIFGGYGMTETTPLALFNPLDDRRKHGSMGVPQESEVDIRIVDPESGDIISNDELGELQIKGSTVTPGYYDSPEDNNRAFTDNRWLKTGDIVQRDENGIIWFVDRKDDMIVTGGENVYPREIEETLYNHPSIGNVAVVGVPDDRFVNRIKAVIVSNETLSPEEVRNFCEREGLADYKHPREIEVVEELPKTASGKIDKKSLET